MGRWLMLFVTIAGCGDGPKQRGELGANCYPNGTCNITLTCIGGLCVAIPDASIDAAPSDAPIDSPPDAPPDAHCEALVAPPPADHHESGMGCMTAAGCHNAGLGLGTNAAEYSYGGTVYMDTAGTQPYAGATVLVTLGSVTKKVIAGDQGNFQLTPALLAAPTNGMTATTYASVCPNIAPMIGVLIGGGGNCNAGGTCHGPGGSAGRIHVP